ncbi:hypothetical protein [Francisella adeliensis]|uniref:Uncharacterized protein n=1 Tax=Francisella adeliensis TaxID=2007306 RepID=A0A2Z4Y0R4_9GAMM|nr:hypothetical protein [Francisella adeliensis]AXA34660.1 hypothetical protein CDH04_09730 [Francisella adeliensis]MBK2086388.1 hypothetical protein [Francisella adeliensis]MBK2096603.1 hypothetical protein [Francisella adeliensis]QIW12904.1 hypothetical protein FZC43_09740 [Francisella adeliensis]QIW14780.1 hypothetical protein FZC44_09730 [Francisella adeliensis]
MECLVDHALEEKLENFFTHMKNTNQILEGNIMDVHIKFAANPDDLSRKLRHFLWPYALRQRIHKSDISEQYGKERQYIRPLQNRKSVYIQSIQDDEGINRHLNLSQIGNTEVQKSYRGYQNPRPAIGQNFTNNIWDELCNSLEDLNRSYDTYHSTLETRTTVDLYAITIRGERFIVEFAQTDPQCINLLRKSLNNANQRGARIDRIDAPICWIRNIYKEDSDLTSFGTYKSIPISLSFLVQKPCDYISQVSSIAMDEQVGNSLQQSLIDAAVINDRYLKIGLLNEITNPLLVEYKRLKRLPLILTRHAHNVRRANQRCYLYCYDEIFDSLKDRILVGIDNYLDITYQYGGDELNRNHDGIHGKKGSTRAGQLRIAIRDCGTTDDLGQILSLCFVNNRVGTFTGGIFSKVRAYNMSLFTFVIESIGQLFSIYDTPPRIDNNLSKLHRAVHQNILYNGNDDVRRLLMDRSNTILRTFTNMVLSQNLPMTKKDTQESKL